MWSTCVYVCSVTAVCGLGVCVCDSCPQAPMLSVEVLYWQKRELMAMLSK